MAQLEVLINDFFDDCLGIFGLDFSFSIFADFCVKSRILLFQIRQLLYRLRLQSVLLLEQILESIDEVLNELTALVC